MSKRAAAETATSSTKKVKSAAITSFFKKDGVSSSSTPRTDPIVTPTTPFDKSEWLSTLDATKRQLLSLEIETLHESWLSALHSEITKPYFLKLKEFLARERKTQTIFPPEADVYAWSRLTPLHSIKVVIIGQDPYHNINQAHGLCFSVQSPCPAPPSLKNIYKALKRDYPSFTVPTQGDLSAWANQGVLLLNSCLTVRAHHANSHQKQGWETFTQRVLDLVASRRAASVFMAWGKPAAERVKTLDTRRHLKLESVHPSPLSASRGFFECRHFVRANEWIAENRGAGEVIDWDCLAKRPEQHAGGPEKSNETVVANARVSVIAGAEKSSGGSGDGRVRAQLMTEESFGISPEEEEALLDVARDQVQDQVSSSSSPSLVPDPSALQKESDVDGLCTDGESESKVAGANPPQDGTRENV